MIRLFKSSLILLLVSLSACSSYNDIFDFDQQKLRASTYSVTLDDIYKYADLSQVRTKSNSLDYSISPILNNNNDTVMYHLQYVDNWEVIASDKRIDPIIMKGNGTLDLLSLNPNTKHWLDGISEMITALKYDSSELTNVNTSFWEMINPSPIATKTSAPDDTMYGWRLIGEVVTPIEEIDIPHIIETKWTEYSPWNECTPYCDTLFSTRSRAGSAAVAYSQILYWSHYYYGIPAFSYTVGSRDGYQRERENFGSFQASMPSIDAWDNMAKSSTSSGSTNYVAILMGWVGKALNLRYNWGGDGSPDNYHNPAVSWHTLDSSISDEFGLFYDVVDYSPSIIASNLRNGIPSIIESKPQNAEFADLKHDWIIDGMYSHSENIKWYYIYDPNHEYNPNSNIDDQEDDGEFDNNVSSFSIPDGYECRIQEFNSSYLYLRMNWGADVDANDYLFNAFQNWNVNLVPNPYIQYYFSNSKKLITNFRP